MMDKLPEGLCAVVTRNYNDEIFLPIWLKYYSRWFNDSDIYVIDDHSSDGSITRALEVTAFNLWMAELTETFTDHIKIEQIKLAVRDLLESYACVIYCDPDELLIADPEKYPEGLGQYIAAFVHSEKQFIEATSRSVMHFAYEDAIDLERPILEQRDFWFKELYYDKPILTKLVLNWALGMSCVSIGYRTDKNREEEYFMMDISHHNDSDLILLHLKRMDLDIWRDKLEAIQSSGRLGEIRGHNWYYRPSFDGKEALKFFYTGFMNSMFEPIPDKFKKII